MLRKNTGKNAKIEDFGLPKPSQNPSKIDVPKNIQFFIDFGSIFVVCCKGRTSKFMRPRSVLLMLHTKRIFAFRMDFGSKKPTKNPSKTRSEPFKDQCQKRVIFKHRFFRVLDSILGPLGSPSWSQVGSKCLRRR